MPIANVKQIHFGSRFLRQPGSLGKPPLTPGATVEFFTDGPPLTKLGCHRVRVNPSDLTDANFAAFVGALISTTGGSGKLQLRELNLTHTHILGECLRYAKNNMTMEWLLLDRSQLICNPDHDHVPNPNPLVSIGQIENLAHLCIRGCEVVKAPFKDHLPEKLVTLDVGETAITDNDVANILSRCKNLKYFYLDGTNTTIDGVKAVLVYSKSSSLKVVDLNNLKIKPTVIRQTIEAAAPPETLKIRF